MYCAPLAKSSEIVDLLRLRDALCHLETRGHPNPQWAVGDAGAAWGQCQIQYQAAITVGGFPKTTTPGALFDLEINRQVALNIVTWCRVVRGRKTVLGIAACFNGPKMEYPKRHDPRPAYQRLRAYAEKVMQAYKKGKK